MAIYDAGTASLTADGTVNGVGTTWRQPLTLIRVGATMIFNTTPASIVTIAEIISDTEIRVFNDKGFTAPAGTQYSILAHDGITVQGLAQDVAETLRYYQSRETEVADAADAFNNFDANDFSAKVSQVNTQHGDVVTIGAQVANYAAQVSADKDAAAASADSASLDRVAAAASAQEAADYAASLDTENLLRKDLSLSDLTDKQLARQNLDVYSRSESEDLIIKDITSFINPLIETDQTDAFIDFVNYAIENNFKEIDLKGMVISLNTRPELFTVSTEGGTTGPRVNFIDISGSSGFSIKNGTVNINHNMENGECNFIKAYDVSNLTIESLNATMIGDKKYVQDESLKPVNCLVRVRADTKSVERVNFSNCLFKSTHTSGSGVQGESVNYGKLIPLFLDAQIYSSRGDLHFCNDVTIRDSKFPDCVEYGIYAWGVNNCVIDNVSITNYGGPGALPAIRHFSFGTNVLRICNSSFFARDIDTNSYAMIQSIYGTDDPVNTDNGRGLCYGVSISNSVISKSKNQAGVRLGNVNDVLIDNVMFISSGNYAADSSSGLADIFVQNINFLSNPSLNAINRISINECSSKNRRRFFSISDTAGAAVKNVEIKSSTANSCHSFAYIASEKAYVSNCKANGSQAGSAGFGIIGAIPSGTPQESAYHEYEGNDLSYFADSISVPNQYRDRFLLNKNILKSITNSLSNDANYSAVRTTTSTDIGSLTPRFVGEIVRTTDTSRAYIATSMSGWLPL